MFTLNCKGKLLAFDAPVVMGIINATPDSFYKSYSASDIGAITAIAKQMIADGAAILDIGGQSTRPGSERISAGEELERVLPAISAILQEIPEAVLSIDTYSSEVAEAAVAAGAAIVNDISGGDMDDKMLAIVARLKVPYICMHMQGTPGTMQEAPHYDNLVEEVLDHFIAKTAQCRSLGITDVIIDPGFGFGKTIAHNFELLHGLAAFSILERPLLAGLSRKRTVYRTLGVTPEQALNGTTVLNTIALLNGAAILRVHDTKEAVEAVKLVDTYQKKTPP